MRLYGMKIASRQLIFDQEITNRQGTAIHLMWEEEVLLVWLLQ